MIQALLQKQAPPQLSNTVNLARATISRLVVNVRIVKVILPCQLQLSVYLRNSIRQQSSWLGMLVNAVAAEA